MRVITVLFSTGRTDIVFVYPIQTEIRMRKPKPNSEMSRIMPNGFAGSLEMRGKVLIANASPKMTSESDSILDRDIRGTDVVVFSSKVKSRLVG